ncbi:MAG: hypothetical protein KDC87_01255 [Planctomycetes bacterium]|nr:hypothetical protein [Planctomycetota bacterium]MCB9868454.1 hypothetical protein [Planctomycetota bacterium]
MPALNGVRTFDRVRWQGAFPGIEGRFRCPSTGLEWYLLRNGDVLTTARMPGTEGGRPVERDLIVHVRREQVVRVRAPREGR